MRHWLAVLVFTSVGTASALAASFDCAKARSIPEKLICTDPDLSRRDEDLAKVYRAAQKLAASKEAFAREAAEAWRRREKTCEDVLCISAWYDERQAKYTSQLAAAPTGTIAADQPIKAERGLGQLESRATGDAGRDEALRQVAEAQRCIEFSQRTIDAENEIGRTVGYVNKVALYQAGRNLVICRQNLARHQVELNNHR